MAGRSCESISRPSRDDLIPLPTGSELFVLPDRIPVGIEKDGKTVTLAENPYNPAEEVQAVAAFMAPAHTAIHTAAYKTIHKEASPLPLFAYTAVGWHQGRFWVTAFRSDPDHRQDADRFDSKKIERQTIKRLKDQPDNRLVQHLGKCCLTYGCPAARNYFLARWEAPLPSSPACNADCVGCISLQASGCCPATQDRIKFVPTPAEITAVAVPHLNKAPRPIVSFGQGCEGEPLLQEKTIAEAIRLIRSRTGKGTINLNSNASIPGAVESLAHAGLDSIRVSMNSARKREHSMYYRPKGFDLDSVCQSIEIMKNRKRFVSLNYFILPGFTDAPLEFSALCGLLERYQPDMIQLRNLNMDPDLYFRSVGHTCENPIGMRRWHQQLQKLFPALRFGYFNPPLK